MYYKNNNQEAKEMELIKDIKENEYEEMVGKVYFNYVEDYIDLRFEKNIPMEYVYQTAEKLNSIQETLIDEICRYSIVFCKDVLERRSKMKEEVNNLNDPKGIFKYMQFDELVVNLPEDMSCYGINLVGSCDWDEENGIQWLIKEDAVVYAGPWADLNIWYSPYEEFLCNYVTMENE